MALPCKTGCEPSGKCSLSAHSMNLNHPPKEQIMNNTSISRCAVAGCSGRWHKLGEGKLFLLRRKRRSLDASETKKVWLCENCFDSWGVTLDLDGRVSLSPRQKKSSYIALKHIAAAKRTESLLLRRIG
jgi:hypothetical protein